MVIIGKLERSGKKKCKIERESNTFRRVVRFVRRRVVVGWFFSLFIFLLSSSSSSTLVEPIYSFSCFVFIYTQVLLTFWLRGHFGSIRRSSGSRLTFTACCDWWCELRSKPISFCERPGTSSWACPFTSFAGALCTRERKIVGMRNNCN